MENQTLQEILPCLCASVKLERDKAEEALKKCDLLQNLSIIENFIVTNVTEQNSGWKKIYGGLVAARLICQASLQADDVNIKNHILQLEVSLRSHLFACNEHGEFRVRIAAGECLGAFCSINNSLFLEYLNPVKRGISSNMEREIDEESRKKLASKLTSNEIFHDTAGWKALETWLKCLQCLIAGLGEKFGELRYCQDDPDILQLLFTCLKHTNRFVRETGYQLLGTLIENNVCISDADILLRIAQQLQIGMSDNWSQVRMASSVATRQLFLFLSTNKPSGQSKEISPRPLEFVSEVLLIYPILLPALCLNRYYIAEGVRLFNQRTWHMVTGTNGRSLIESYIEPTIEFYIRQTDADNHAVREAACACLSELGSKLNVTLLEPYVAQLLNALMVCFDDDSWPVRDAACVAAGKLVAAFPQQTLQLYPGDGLWSRFHANLLDSIPSVRQGGAVAAATALMAMQDEQVTEKAFDYLSTTLLMAKEQSPDSIAKSGVSARPAVYSVARDSPMDDSAHWHDERHSNQQMYSCGSLAPKMHKGGGRKGGGCHDGLFHKLSEPWERSDGCLLLMAELATLMITNKSDYANSLAQRMNTTLVPKLSELANCRHFPHHVYLLETFCKCVPRLSQGLGKLKFKPFLQDILSALCYAVGLDTALTKVAAEEALISLSQQFGPSIIRGRIEMIDPKLIQHLSFLPI